MGILMVWMVNPEIDRRISKKLKKTELPGKTSWKIPIWHFVFYKWLFPKKIQSATLSINLFKEKSSFSQSAWIFPRIWLLKTFKILVFKFCLLDLFFFSLNNGLSWFSQEKRFGFKFQQCFVFASHAFLFTDRRSGALSQKRS